MNIKKGSRYLAEALDELADDLAERIAGKLNRVERPGRDTYYDSTNNPLGKRAFLDAARRGAFPSYKVGRRVLALRRDVDAFILARARKPSERPVKSGDDRELLRRAGLRFRTPHRRE